MPNNAKGTPWGVWGEYAGWKSRRQGVAEKPEHKRRKEGVKRGEQRGLNERGKQLWRGGPKMKRRIEQAKTSSSGQISRKLGRSTRKIAKPTQKGEKGDEERGGEFDQTS